MPKSKTRKKARSAPPESKREELRARGRPAWLGKTGWAIAIFGVLMFLVGNIGARTGVTFLPFDPHHVGTQLLGAVVIAVGFSVATGGTRRR